MKNRLEVRCLLAALILSIIAAQAAAAPQKWDAKELSRRLDRLYRSASSHATVSMTVTTPHFERTMKLEMWSRGMEDTLARILSPPKERGTATLKRGGEMWNYLPKIDKTIRVPPSMMTAAWMGSDFTNDDLMRETTWETDYDVSLLENPPPGQAALVYVPKPEAPVSWSRVVGFFDEETLFPQSIEYYDEKNRKVRVMTFDEIGNLGGRTLPRRMTLTPLSEDKQGNRTVMVYEEAAFDIKLPADLFSLTTLRQGK
jgi:outer membrane lipoprotein-sorting protein